eukprot:1162066-Pelagomonas_calceolata.AAC.8
MLLKPLLWCPPHPKRLTSGRSQSVQKMRYVRHCSSAFSASTLNGHKQSMQENEMWPTPQLSFSASTQCEHVCIGEGHGRHCKYRV